MEAFSLPILLLLLSSILEEDCLPARAALPTVRLLGEGGRRGLLYLRGTVELRLKSGFGSKKVYCCRIKNKKLLQYIIGRGEM